MRRMIPLLVLAFLLCTGCTRATPEQIERVQGWAAEARQHAEQVQAQRDAVMAALPEIRKAVERAEALAANTGSEEALAMAQAARAKLEAALATVERYQHLADVAANQAQQIDAKAQELEAGTPWWQIVAGIVGTVAAGLGGARALPGTGRAALKLFENPQKRVQLAREILLQQEPMDPHEAPTDRLPRGA